jgi:serine protease AprX
VLSIPKAMRKLFIVILILWNIALYSQDDAWVYFTAKTNTQYYLENPLEMLSQRAIDRRIRQQIALDERDVPIAQEYINQIQAVEGITVLAKSKWMNAIHVRGESAVINQLRSLPMVERVQFANRSMNNAGRLAALQEANEVTQKLETQITHSYGNTANQIEMLHGNVLHAQDFTGSGKIIAVLDNGFIGVNTALPFNRLVQNNLILGGYDFVNRSNNFYTGGNHGTMVLSTMGAFQEEVIVGTAPDAGYYLFITEATAYENPVEESYWVEAAEKADSLGVDIINTSLGYFQYDNTNYSYSFGDINGTSFISQGADIAYAKGMICVTSAGNSGNTPFPNIAVPADALHTLTVGAVNATGAYASFSSVGPTADNRLKPDIVAQGVAAVVATPEGTIGGANGTSFSSPIIAGLVACLWQALPSATNAQIIQWIKESAHLYQQPNYQMGYGIPNFRLAYHQAQLSVNQPTPSVFTLTPNPFSTTLQFNNVQGAEGTFELYSIVGQKVRTQKITASGSMDTHNVPSGIYIYKWVSQGTTVTGKLIKK